MQKPKRNNSTTAIKSILIAYDGSECSEAIFTELQHAGLPPQLDAHVVAVAAEQWNADCLFIGASGLQHPATETLGTVASALAVRAHCSVEIVRP